MDAPAPPAASAPRLGVLAFGDSITNAGGELQWGVALHSWALWTARGLGLAYTGFAVDGARAGAVVGEQLPAFLRRTATPAARYDIGCLYIGVNDVRARDWEPARFAAEFETALAFLDRRCERTLALSLPRRLGVPPAAAKVTEANAIIARTAASLGALVVDLGSFGARNHVMADRVHPTALGQVAIAQRALAELAADGLAARVDPATLLRYETTRLGRLRADLTYTYRSTKSWARGLARGALSGGG